MPQAQISITKQGPWQGGFEKFSNVYTVTSASLTSAKLRTTAQKILDIEQNVHAENVEFLEMRAYEFQGTPQENTTFFIEEGEFANGERPPSPGLYAETALLVKFPLGRAPVTNRKRQLMKWLHLYNLPGTVFGDAMESGTVRLNLSVFDYMRTNYILPLLGMPGDVFLSAPNGDIPGDGQVHPFLEHRQFHKGPQRIRRGQVI